MKHVLTLLLLLLATIIFFPAATRALRRITVDFRVTDVALADVNHDGFLDAFLVGSEGSAVHPPYLLMNDGAGRFDRDVRAFDRWPGGTATLGDLNGDGSADLLLGLFGGGIIRYLNEGAGDFPAWDTLVAPGPLGVMYVRPVLGDLDGDGRLDIFSAGCCGRPADMGGRGNEPLDSYSQVWLSGPEGGFEEVYKIGHYASHAVALADLDGDGDLDAFLANGRTLLDRLERNPATANAILFNDGDGHFTDSDQQLGRAVSKAVALGDINGYGFADAVVGNQGSAEVWLNDGRGYFGDSENSIGRGPAEYVFLVELNGDGWLDLLLFGESGGEIWLNDGTGQFGLGQLISYGRGAVPAVGDVTGDGLLDLFVADVDSYRIWRGRGDGQFSHSGARYYR